MIQPRDAEVEDGRHVGDLLEESWSHLLGEQLFLDCFLERWKKIHEGYDQKLNDWDEKKGVVKCLVVKIMEERMWKEIRATNKR